MNTTAAPATSAAPVPVLAFPISGPIPAVLTATRRLSAVKLQVSNLKTQVKYYVHDPLHPLNATFTTANLKGRVAHNIRAGDIPERLRVGDPIPLWKTPKKIGLVKPCAAHGAAKTGGDANAVPCTDCAKVQARLRATDPTIRLYDPAIRADDDAHCAKVHGSAKAARQMCVMDRACKRRGRIERGVPNGRDDNAAYDTSMEVWRGGKGLVRAGTATFCCHRNRAEAFKIAAAAARVLQAAGAKPAAEQVKVMAAFKGKAVTPRMVREEERKQSQFIQTVAPIAIAAEQNNADKVVLGVALSTINFLKIETKKRLEQVIDMIEGLEYTPSKKNKIATAFVIGSAAGAAAYSASGGSATGGAVTGLTGALYGYARGSTGVIKDIIETIKFASEKILAFVSYVLSDPKRAAFVLETFVMIRRSLCGIVSRAIYKEPIRVQQSMFAAAADGAQMLSETGSFVAKRIFVEALDNVFSGPMVGNMVSKLTSLTSFTMGPLGAAGGFLAEVVGTAASDIMQVYSKHALMQHYFEANATALNALIFSSCIVQPVEKVVTAAATLNSVASTLNSVKGTFIGQTILYPQQMLSGMTSMAQRYVGSGSKNTNKNKNKNKNKKNVPAAA